VLATLIQSNGDHEPEIIAYIPCENEEAALDIEREVFAGKKYKPVDQKVRPVKEPLPEEFRII